MRNGVAQWALVPCFALITTAMASVAEAGPSLNAHLRGAYAFTTARTCTVSSVAFVGPTFAIPFPLPPTFFRQSTSDAGIITFNGDGTGTATGRSRSMNITSTGGSPLSVSEFTNNFDYTVNPDGTVDTASSINFETVFGAGLGNTGTVSGQVGRLQIAHGNTMLVSAPSGDPTVETLDFTPPSGPPFTQYRICVRSTTATKLPGR